MRRTHIWLLIGLVLLGLATTGCRRRFKLNVTAGPCLNPPDLYCNDDGSGSRVLEVRVYQLSTWIDPAALAWEDLLNEDQAYDFLKSYLTDPDEKTTVYNKFTIEADDHSTFKLYRLRGTKYLLIFNAGRNRGNNSILVLPIAWAQKDEKLYFEYYDVKAPSKLRELLSPDPNKPPQVDVP